MWSCQLYEFKQNQSDIIIEYLSDSCQLYKFKQNQSYETQFISLQTATLIIFREMWENVSYLALDEFKLLFLIGKLGVINVLFRVAV